MKGSEGEIRRLVLRAKDDDDDAPTNLQATLAGGALLTGILMLFPIGLVFFAYVLVRSLGAGILMYVDGGTQPQLVATSGDS